MLPANYFSYNGHPISSDSAGRYNLSELHKALGGEDKTKPALFLRLQMTEQLIQAIAMEKMMYTSVYHNSSSPNPSDSPEKMICRSADHNSAPSTLPDSPEKMITGSRYHNSAPVNIVRGRGKKQGTYVCEELMLFYATWISADVHLKVLRSFLDSRKKAQLRLGSVDPTNDLNETLRTNLPAEASDNERKYMYSNEATMIDSLALGKYSHTYCREASIDHSALRDYLAVHDTPALEKIVWLTKQDDALINLGLDYHARKAKLAELLETKFKSKLKPS